MMTPAEKAKETRKRNEEARNQKRSEELRTKEAIRKGCVEVLEADDTTPDQKLEACRILSEIIKAR